MVVFTRQTRSLLSNFAVVTSRSGIHQRTTSNPFFMSLFGSWSCMMDRWDERGKTLISSPQYLANGARVQSKTSGWPETQKSHLFWRAAPRFWRLACRHTSATSFPSLKIGGKLFERAMALGMGSILTSSSKKLKHSSVVCRQRTLLKWRMNI